MCWTARMHELWKLEQLTFLDCSSEMSHLLVQRMKMKIFKEKTEGMVESWRFWWCILYSLQSSEWTLMENEISSNRILSYCGCNIILVSRHHIFSCADHSVLHSVLFSYTIICCHCWSHRQEHQRWQKINRRDQYVLKYIHTAT